VGEGKALEMNLTGTPINAFEAYEYDLVNDVVPDHELFDTSLRWARKMAQQAPLAIEKIKRVSHHGKLKKGLKKEAEAFGEVFGSADAKEGIGAFLGKRTPKFQGK
jgi:enoyl-CoA hydratase/3-hydroxyacyl-CoA dehydrogenase